jgi:hypothetical protein
MEKFSSEQGQLVCILNDSRNSNCSAPVVVQMSQLVCEHLELIGTHADGVVDDVVARWRDCSLTDTLTDEIEVVAETIQSKKLLFSGFLIELTVLAT